MAATRGQYDHSTANLRKHCWLPWCQRGPLERELHLRSLPARRIQGLPTSALHGMMVSSPRGQIGRSTCQLPDQRKSPQIDGPPGAQPLQPAAAQPPPWCGAVLQRVADQLIRLAPDLGSLLLQNFLCGGGTVLHRVADYLITRLHIVEVLHSKHKVRTRKTLKFYPYIASKANVG